ncbi:hypothetical protein CRG98_048475 [Punica granatum]|uniref:Uncharacterized protein n=1 Tax=Punica granatum TaxID=22663 RepID=A0A2I0HHP2_PUNGR|nr:hypothetical protein CRG98_048475 [Punica granatum]
MRNVRRGLRRKAKGSRSPSCIKGSEKSLPQAKARSLGQGLNKALRIEGLDEAFTPQGKGRALPLSQGLMAPTTTRGRIRGGKSGRIDFFIVLGQLGSAC